MVLEDLFLELGAILVIAAVLSALAFRLRQPLIIAYIVAGIVVGPSVFGIVHSHALFAGFSKIGVALLLFTVGLGLNWRTIKEVGGVSLATGVGQVVATSLFGWGIGLLLGLTPLASAYVAVAFSFSSTIIIVKLLLDKDDLSTLYGRISVGFLLVQDFIALLILLALSALGQGGNLGQVLLVTLGKGMLLLPVLWFVSAKAVPRLFAFFARSQELLFVAAIAWCFLIAGGLSLLGFGMEIGALIAGITLSGTLFEREILARIKPLRDFFLILFFLVLGSGLTLGALPGQAVAILVFSLYILVGNPLIMQIIMRLLGYHSRTGFLAGTTVAQISEFSFIVIAAGVSLGHVDPSLLSLATAVGLITIAGSSYMVSYNEQVYNRLERHLRWLNPSHTQVVGAARPPVQPEVLLMGFHRMGTVLLPAVRRLKEPFLVVDSDPETIRRLAASAIPAVYGDAGDSHFLEEILAHRCKLIISTIPEVTTSLALLTFLKTYRYRGSVIVSARTHAQAAQCYEAGAQYVLISPVLGGEKFGEMLSKKGTSKAAWRSLAAAAQKDEALSGAFLS